MNVQSFCLQMGKTGCLAFSYARIATDGYEGSEIDRNAFIIKKMMLAVEHGSLDADMTVLDASRFIHEVNPLVSATVQKKRITSLDEIKEHRYACVNFVNGIANHWVWVKNGKVNYNSLDYSNCVEKGRPFDARIVTIKELD